jgi:hypothetical protein
MMLSFDLEGISNDGFGYTVAITGPSKQKSPNQRNMFRLARINFLDLKGKRDCPPPAVMRELAVTTEITVAESRSVSVVVPLKGSDFV